MPPLKNVLSLSSAGKNRYLLHFSTFNSLTQWTAAIRLAMYEHTSLYEAYTGALIAAKGKHLPGIQSILMPAKFKHEDWARVRFGAGTPWRRCWFVINPPDEKEAQKARKKMKKSAYDRLTIPITGNIQFFETKKTKKVQPIATLTQVYSAYAIYPQSKALIDQSTLVKLEGRIHMHSQNQPPSGGFVFIMPELHAAVCGFETMLRFLFPTFDTFNLYGRPTRLVADTNHIKSMMFAFPKERRYGYLDVLDIANLLQSPGSQQWSEAEWRKQLKAATQKRMSTGRSRANSNSSAKPRYRNSLVSMRHSDVPVDPARRPFAPPASKPDMNQAPEAVVREVPPGQHPAYDNRGLPGAPEPQPRPRPGYRSLPEGLPPSSVQDWVQHDRLGVVAPIAERASAESDRHAAGAGHAGTREEQLPPRTPPSPVANPPSFVHGPRAMPARRPEANEEQRLANNRMSHATLSQLTSVGKMGMTGQRPSHAPNFQDQRAGSNIDQPRQNRTPRSSHVAESTDPRNLGLAHPSGNEGLGLSIPVRAPPPPEHRPPTPSSGGKPSPQQRIPIDTTKAVKRKPLPQRPVFAEAPLSPDGEEPSYEDLRHTLDEDVLNRIAPRLPSPVSPNRNEEESIYDDASVVTPDYASTHESVHSKQSQNSVSRPRMGVMKTVGMPNRQDLVIGDAHYSTEKPRNPNPDIPSVDFGPTLAYMPTTGRPSTAETPSKPRMDAQGAERYKLSVPTHPMDRSYNAQSPSQDEYRRSVAWQPGMATNRPVTSGRGLSPEYYVQQQAAPSPPMHMHQHTPYNNATLPQQPVSREWGQHARPGPRMNSYQDNTNYRPSSRGAGPMRDNYNDGPTHLSAREQEHVARMTGSSFFNLKDENRRPPAPLTSGGLVSSIDAREREKRQMRQGMSNQMVQHAIAQRQQHPMHQPQFAPPPPPPPRPADSLYPPQPPQQPMYNLPAASHTWDALHQMNRPDEPRRRSWYGQLPQASQGPPGYQQSQRLAQQGPYPSHYNMRY